MPIVTISRGSYYHAKSVAEKLAEKLGYRCVSRDQLIEGLEEFHLPEIKLVRNLKDAFSVLDRFPHGKKRFIAAMKSAILERLSNGSAVYHGLIAQHFLNDISHVVKVRIVADTEGRIADDMRRQNITEEQARFILKNDDDERRKWGMFLYGVDINDPENYDLVINIDGISQDEAVDIITTVTQLESFQETPESAALVADLALKAKLETTLFDFPNASIKAKNGTAAISLKVPENQKEVIQERIEEMIAPIETLKDFSLSFEPFY